MERYMESCLALFNTNVESHYIDSTGKVPDLKRYIVDETIEHGPRIKIREDAYYVFDFYDSEIGRRIHYNEVAINECNFIRSERVEVMHAFLACLRSETSIRSKITSTAGMDFIDNFIICTTKNAEIENLIDNPTNFSTHSYMQLFKLKLEKEFPPELKPKDERETLRSVILMMSKIFSNSDKFSICILGLIYRASVYYNLGLDMQSVLLLKSVFEYFVKKTHKKMSNVAQYYIDNNISEKDQAVLMNLKDLRDAVVHDLKLPRHDQIGESIRIIERIFCSQHNIKLSIPVGKTTTIILEE